MQLAVDHELQSSHQHFAQRTNADRLGGLPRACSMLDHPAGTGGAFQWRREHGLIRPDLRRHELDPAKWRVVSEIECSPTQWKVRRCGRRSEQRAPTFCANSQGSEKRPCFATNLPFVCNHFNFPNAVNYGTDTVARRCSRLLLAYL